MAAAYFCARAGVPVTLFEKADALGGIVRQVIPDFRISGGAIDKDAALVAKMGAEIRLNTPAPSVAELKAQGYTHIFFAVGAWKAGRLDIPGNVAPVIGWLRDLKAGKDVPLGHVAVVGGGNTAMDAARAALRAGAKSSTLVYRRTKKYMPADAEELELAVADGVSFLELVAPVEQKDGKLRCEKMKLGDPDEKGRRKPEPTGEFVEIDCDTVISAVGEQVESQIFTANGIQVDEKGLPAFRTNVEGVFAGGDCASGPSTVIRAVEAGKTAAANIDAYLGFHTELPQDVEIPPAQSAVSGPCGRVTLGERPAAERACDFELAEEGMTRQAAMQECSRCLRCDHYGFGSFRGGRNTKW